jgi:hypothetical protein
LEKIEKKETNDQGGPHGALSGAVFLVSPKGDSRNSRLAAKRQKMGAGLDGALAAWVRVKKMNVVEKDPL